MQINTLRNTALAGLSAIALMGLSACGDGDTTVSVTQPSATQIDRMGRAGVNTAVTDPFYISDDGGMNDAAHGALTDSFNAVGTQMSSVMQFTDRFADNIAIYDGLDTNCGNQLAAGDEAVDGRYDGLATVLADDELFVNTASGTCNQYFGVELDALGVTMSGDCGGRTPLYDTIDVTYSALAIGDVAGVGDGIDSDPDPVTHSAETFPFLAAPS
ncbi:DUF4331 domain-containing protein [bacterium]|nr:DUF4331 domain-containing protein [bacterium]